MYMAFRMLSILQKLTLVLVLKSTKAVEEMVPNRGTVLLPLFVV